MSTTNVAAVYRPFEALTFEFVEEQVTKLGTGLRNFAVCAPDPRCGPLDSVEVRTVDPETAARRCLAVLTAVPETPILPVGMPTQAVEFVLLGTETVALTGTRVVKFIQHYRRIPVYDSLVTVELNADNTLLTMHTVLGWPAHVDPVATLSPLQALTVAGAGRSHVAPTLWYFFDHQTRSAIWRLVYVVAGISHAGVIDASVAAPEFADDVIDAHSGNVVARLPRAQSGAGRTTIGRPAGTSTGYKVMRHGPSFPIGMM